MLAGEGKTESSNGRLQPLALTKCIFQHSPVVKKLEHIMIILSKRYKL